MSPRLRPEEQEEEWLPEGSHFDQQDPVAAHLDADPGFDHNTRKRGRRGEVLGRGPYSGQTRAQAVRSSMGAMQGSSGNPESEAAKFRQKNMGLTPQSTWDAIFNRNRQPATQPPAAAQPAGAPAQAPQSSLLAQPQSPQVDLDTPFSFLQQRQGQPAVAQAPAPAASTAQQPPVWQSGQMQDIVGSGPQPPLAAATNYQPHRRGNQIVQRPRRQRRRSPNQP